MTVQMCAGDSSQVCGGGNLITAYEDPSWSDPTREELAEALIALVYAMNGLSNALTDWRDAALAASIPSRMMHKRAPPCSMRSRLRPGLRGATLPIRFLADP